MLRIGNRIYSFDLFREQFVCDLEKCHGACCVHGDSGAPLETEEAEFLDENFPAIIPFLRPEAVRYIEKTGKHVIDSDNDTVTPLLNGKECAYTVFEKGIAFCGIEKAWNAGVITFRKPLSCHLYPVRKTRYKDFDAFNYHEWEICKPARVKGSTLNVPVYEFCKDALIRDIGEDEFSELKIAHRQLDNHSQ